jgi:uncharacterized protein (TIGR03118 family)
MRRIIVSILASFALVSALPAAAQFVAQHDLVSDVVPTANPPDPNLINPWGLVSSATSPWWVANNGTGTSRLYDGTGAARALTVQVPGAVTGLVFNGGAGFVVKSGSASGPARFIFASEDGIIFGWNPAVPAPPPTPSTHAVIAADESASNAVYKGLAIASTAAGDFLYAADFRNAKVSVFDSAFNPVAASGGFRDAHIPDGYAPFGIQNIGGTIYVTYAKQDGKKHDDVPGHGHGFVTAFDTSGHKLRRIASRGRLDSPWGLARAPAGFGTLGGDLLVGNFGDGRINIFDLTARSGDDDEGAIHRGQLRTPTGARLSIDGLWALQFGNGAAAGPTGTLFFTAGIEGENHGLFGSLTPVAPPPDEDAAPED